ncbi:hypothetical protein [Kribbella sp. NPDC048915]|uniref:hypothetical protein n=1 Tax=Kribbella sp. NPDC048915 TaxID=3155148 RepID=UPI00340222E0
MSDLEKSRIQRDVRRSAATRRGSTTATQALIRHLGVETYRESRRSSGTPKQPEAPGADVRRRTAPSEK